VPVEQLDRAGRERVPVARPAGPADLRLDEIRLEARRGEDLERLGHDDPPDAVSGHDDDGGARHGRDQRAKATRATITPDSQTIE